MKRLFLSIAFACLAIVAFSQNKVLRPRMEISQFETEENNIHLEVFYMDDESPRMYYLSLGNLGVGGDIVQFQIDPLFELFIPLGGTLQEAIAKMQEFKDFFKQPRLSKMETSGCFCIGYPNGDYEPVTLTRRKVILENVLEFSIQREGFIRATYISKSELSGILSSTKIYKKIHPKQQ